MFQPLFNAAFLYHNVCYERNRTLDIDYIALLENEREFFKNNICSLNDQKKIAIKKISRAPIFNRGSN